MQKHLVRILFACSIFLTWHLNGRAQDYRFINYTHRDGLPNTKVQCLLQDKKGYIWIGTQDGLLRYDGYAFKGFYHNDHDSASILHNNILCIYEDRYGFVWSGSNKGVSCYDPYSGRFSNYEADTGIQTKLPSIVYQITEDKSGTLWFATRNYPLTKFNRETNSFIRIKRKVAWEPIATRAIAMDKNGMLYLAGRSFWRYDPGRNEFELLDSALMLTLIASDRGEKIFGGYYYTNKIFEYTVSTKKFVSMPGVVGSWLILGFEEKSDSELWLATGDMGLGIYNKTTHSCRFITHKDAPYSIMDGKGVLCVLKDRSGTLWIGHNEGLSKLDPRDQLFSWNTFIRPCNFPNSQLFNRFVKDPHSGNIYALGEHCPGIYVIDRQNNYTIIPDPDKNSVNRQVNDITIDSKGQLWAANRDFLEKYNRKTGKMDIVPMAADSNAIKNPVLVNIYADRKDRIWVGTIFKGLHMYDPATNTTKSFFPRTRPDFTLDDYFDIAGEDNRGNVWITSRVGFGFYNGETDKFTCFKKTMGAKPLTDSRALAFDNNQNIWIGTGEDGLLLYEPSGGRFSRYSTSDGLCNNEITGIAKDSHGMLWIGTRNGLSRLNPEKKIFTNYTVEAGLPNGEIEGLNIIGDTLYLGLRDVFCTTPISRLDKNSFIPPVVINSFKVFDQDHPYMFRDQENQRIQLSYLQNHFSFEFAALNFTAPGKNRYAYKLEGYDKDWIQAGNRHFASYTYVPGGKYIFRVKASNNDGVWNETGASVPLEVIPPFWEKWWFRILLAILIPSIIIFLVNRRIQFIKNREKDKSALQKQLAELEMKALRAQMNPHFIFNALNSIQQQIVTNDTDNAFLYLDKFARLLRMILDHSEYNLISLQDELKGLNLYIEIESLRFQHSFEYSIHIDESVKQETIKIPGMLLQPYVENAIWHGLLPKEGMRSIRINISIENELLICTIEDNGIGRERAMMLPKKHKHESRGMQITGERLDVIGKIEKTNARVTITDLKDEAGNTLGTRVELAIPVIEEYEKNLAWTH